MYCKLTYKVSADKHRKGDSVLCGMSPLNIGQTASCEVRLPLAQGGYEPELMATVVPLDDGKGWLVACRSETYAMFVNGERVAVASALEGGDEIAFYDCDAEQRNATLIAKFSFETFEDGDYSTASGVTYKPKPTSRRYLLATVLLTLVAMGVALAAWMKDDDLLRHEDFDAFSRYICPITTDSVYLVADTVVDGKRQEMIVDALCMENSARGTCFLTDSGFFVTARHCIEPWINDEGWDGKADVSLMTPALRLATWAETQNRLIGWAKYKLRSHCVIDFGMQQFEFYSTDFKINKSRDQVLCLGDENEPIYWRTIVPIASRRDMELGDVACVKVENIKGSISLATKEDLVSFDEADERDVVILGYPVNDNNTVNVLNKVDGVCQQLEWNDDTTSMVGCIQMSALVNSGNSGGPIFVRVGNDLKVIGIVSKSDTKAQQGTFWAVPSTEIVSLSTYNEEATADTLIFRR